MFGSRMIESRECNSGTAVMFFQHAMLSSGTLYLLAYANDVARVVCLVHSVTSQCNTANNTNNNSL
jgi:hypothetical protein